MASASDSSSSGSRLLCLMSTFISQSVPLTLLNPDACELSMGSEPWPPSSVGKPRLWTKSLQILLLANANTPGQPSPRSPGPGLVFSEALWEEGGGGLVMIGRLSGGVASRWYFLSNFS